MQKRASYDSAITPALLFALPIAGVLVGACRANVHAGTGSAGGGGATSATASAGQTTGSGTGMSCSGAVVHFQADVQPILTCGGAESCHSLTLGKPGGAYAFLVNQPTTQCTDHRLRVAPGDPEHSYLIEKLTNHDICSGKPMPKNLGLAGTWQPLKQAQLQTVYDWICEGAKHD